MGWIKQLFGATEQKPKTALDAVQETIARFMAARYRQMSSFSHEEYAPTTKTSDQEIINIYKKVCTAYWNASNQRGEQIAIEVINAITWKFLQVYEKVGNEFMSEHLDYEIEKYLNEGLRPDYVKMSQSAVFKLPQR